jgi:hypothetical protein
MPLYRVKTTELTTIGPDTAQITGAKRTAAWLHELPLNCTNASPTGVRRGPRFVFFNASPGAVSMLGSREV